MAPRNAVLISSSRRSSSTTSTRPPTRSSPVTTGTCSDDSPRLTAPDPRYRGGRFSGGAPFFQPRCPLKDRRKYASSASTMPDSIGAGWIAREPMPPPPCGQARDAEMLVNPVERPALAQGFDIGQPDLGLAH